MPRSYTSASGQAGQESRKKACTVLFEGSTSPLRSLLEFEGGVVKTIATLIVERYRRGYRGSIADEAYTEAVGP